MTFNIIDNLISNVKEHIHQGYYNYASGPCKLNRNVLTGSEKMTTVEIDNLNCYACF